MTKKPRRLGPSCLVSDSAPNDDDRKSAHRQSQLQRASWQSPRSRTPKPSPSTGLLVLLASFVTSTIPPAHAAPSPVSSNARSPDAIPTPIYLDFLYPRSRSQEQQPTQGSSHVPKELPDPPRRPKHPRAATSPAHECGCVIPIKFEQNDTGWMVAERWTLHGKTHGNALAGYIPISSIRPSMESPNPNVSLDLPTGWNSTATSRPARYDPNIVIVFAIILACCITGAIAATVWRNQHLRAKGLKEDLERATKPKRWRRTDEVESVGSDASIEEEKPRGQTKKKRRRRKASGSGGGAVAGSATKSSSTFWRPSSRFVGRLRFRSRRHKPADVSTTESPVAASRPASPQPHPPPREDFANPPVILVTAEIEQDSSSRVHSRHPSHVNLSLSPTVNEDPETQAEPDGIPASSVTTLPLPVSSIHSSHSVDQDQPIASPSDDIASRLPPAVEGYTSNPPAYLGIGHSWTPRRVEKAPLPGLEAEYDERDLERSRASGLAAGSTSTSPRPRSIARPANESELDMQLPPLQSRVHGVHIATDDKADLARLHSLADQPDATLPPAEAFLLPDAPTVPDFGMVDDWYMETQLEQVSSLDQPSSPTSPIPTLSRLTLPPPPEPYLLSRHSPRHDSFAHDTSYHDTHDMNEAYSFRRVWGGTVPPVGPSAPPMETAEDDFSRGLQRDQDSQGLVPSAPPLHDGPISSAHLPSAPVSWDEENESHEPPGGSVPPLAASSESSPGDERPESTSGSSREGVDAHSDVRVRWVQQRQTDMEGVGLPKYEP